MTVDPPCLPPRCGLRRQLGLTLVELMIVILVAAILAGVALPSLQNFVNANQLVATTDNFASALNLARSEAVKLGTPVALVNSGGATSQDWSSGWTMFVDQDSNGAQGANEPVVRVGGAQPGGYTLKSSGSLTGLIEFDANGRLMNAAPGQFMICQGGGPFGSNGGAARMVTVKATGRVRIAANDASGVPLYDDSTTAATSCTP